jgi:DNA repair exonuclease SbcCD nuclease subunit
MPSIGNKITSKYIGCFSDLHLGLGQDSPVWHKIALDFAKWASEKYKELFIDEIIIPGDIFHNRSQISVETLAVARQFFDFFKDFTIYISTGNHDCFKKDSSDINSISLLDGWNNIVIIDKEPLILETNFNKSIGLVPWGYDISKVPPCDIIFGHFEISSFYMNTYKVCEHGHSYKNMFDIGNCIISGHFHKKDHRKYENNRQITYLGSPFQHNFGDCNDSRGIYVFDVSNNTFKFLENNISPKHFKLSVKNDIDEDIIRNNFISLLVDDEIDQEKLLSYTAKIASFGPTSLRVDHDGEKTKLEISEEKELGNSDLLKNIEEYIESLDIENKKEVVEYVKEMYNSLV